MSFRARISQLDRVQKNRTFKIIATVLIVIAMVLLIGYGLINSDQSTPALDEQMSTLPSTVTNFAGDEIPNPQLARAQQIQEMVARADLGTIVAWSAAISGLILILVVWLNLGLIYPIFAGLAVGLILLTWGTRFELSGGIFAGMISLTLVFLVLMRGVSLALGFAHPVLAIARNVLAEAVRMKISLVFIVMLFFVLAALPMLMDPSSSLRYRVQSFLQYSTGFTFLFVGMLVVFFGAATMSYEQREKVIWQTMTKPVAAWQYVLGKWLGVVVLAGVLLSVSAVGVFQFAEYLRRQPAIGESAPFVPKDGTDITEDRLVLETRVLTSRVTVNPSLPFDINSEAFSQAIEQQIARERQANPGYNPDSAERAAIRQKLFKDEFTQYFSIDPNSERYEEFYFEGLGQAKRLNLPLTLRYKINAEGNRPDMQYILTFAFSEGTVLPPRRTGLGFSHYMTLSPGFIDENGQLRFQIYNGQLVSDSETDFHLETNLNTFTIPPDGLEISYSVGGYRGNFVRVYLVLWVKLALLGMLAVWASTFSSFPVACLIAGGLFFIGESAGFVQDALPGWGKTNADGDPSLYRIAIYHFADWISSLFTIYNDLRPAERLAEGEQLSWGSVSKGVMALGAVCGFFYFIAVLIFNRRQLAIYSGS